MLQQFADWLAYGLLGLDAQSRIGSAVDFFFYDTTKILILLFIISSVMGVINAYFPIDRLRTYLTTHRLYGLQYFITSPLVNEVAVAMFLGTFGLKITIIYVVSGMLLGMIGGFILGKMKLEDYLSDWVKNIQKASETETARWEAEKVSFVNRLPGILRDSWGIIRGVLLYVVIGIAIGGMIHGYVPEGFFQEYMSKSSWFAVPLSVVLGVPMYANAAGIVPVIEVFVAKGVPIGTALSFMMAVVGLSLPEATLLKKVMKWRLIGIFFGTITLFIILLVYLYIILL